MSFRLVASRLPTSAAASSSVLPCAFALRSYATPAAPTLTKAEQKKQREELQAKQLKLAAKAGRMRQNASVSALIPVFANHIRPKEGRILPPGTDLSTKWEYAKVDLKNYAYSLYLKYGFRKMLGKEWNDEFTLQAVEGYKAVNSALASGNYSNLIPRATPAMVDDVKSQRARQLSGLRLNWKLHNVVSQEIVCVRQQEIAKKDEFVAQVAVRFETKQSLEVRDARGQLVKGSHDKPELVKEYYVFQRDMWRPEDDWKIIKKVQENDPMDDPTTAI